MSQFPQTALKEKLWFQNQGAGMAGQVELSSWNSWTGQNVCSAAAGRVEISFWNSWTGRNAVREQRNKLWTATNGKNPSAQDEN